MKTAIFALCLFISVFVSAQNQDEEKNPREKVVQVSTETTENPPTISFKWNPIPGRFDIEIFRKTKNSSNWGNAIAKLPVSTLKYTDKNVEPGIEYEYAIKAKWEIPIETYITAGIQFKEVEYRGKVILLVDSTFVSDLKTELQIYEYDLIGDGWKVLRKDISRDASVKYIKSVIKDFYDSDPENVNCVFLFGHIPVPYSGSKAYDGHKDHDGAWPADMYYGDMNEKIWTDEYVNCTSSDRNENKNVPGDGKFDVCELPKNEIISLAIGRVDFYNMTDFPQSETMLLKNYLNKDHAFRHKIIDPKMQALVDDNFDIRISDQGVIEAFAISGWRNFSALLNFQNIKAGDFFSETKDDSYIWSYACGGGMFDSCKYVGSTNCFVNHSPKTVFTAFYGSRFGDWDSENNFMRAALASNGWILSSCWAGRPQYTFHQMGMGATIGECVRATQNNVNTYYPGCTSRGIHISLLGDPTLRLHIVRPVNSLVTSITENQTVRLTWNSTDNDIVGYYIYRFDKLSDRYKRISDFPVTETTFEDILPEDGDNFYMVRALKLSKVVSGSYYNLSQGVFDTIRFERAIVLAHETNLNEVLIYPNPSTGQFHISFGSFPVNLAILQIYNTHGKLMREELFRNSTLESFDISSLPKGIYIVNSIVGNKKTVTKICLQ